MLAFETMVIVDFIEENYNRLLCFVVWCAIFFYFFQFLFQREHYKSHKQHKSFVVHPNLSSKHGKVDEPSFGFLVVPLEWPLVERQI